MVATLLYDGCCLVSFELRGIKLVAVGVITKSIR